MNDTDEKYYGIVEGFYGRPWNARQRHQLFIWMQTGGLNTYLYAPKDDLKHRTAWRELYDEPEAAELAALIRDCSRHRLNFVYALAPGLDIHYTQPAEFEALAAKLNQVIELGCKRFAILFDDIPAQLDPDSKARFGSFAKAHCEVTHKALGIVRARVPDSAFFFCPTPYCAWMARPSVADCPYLHELGENLLKEIEVFWTGPEIVSETIDPEPIRHLSAILRRKPVIWDNLHANDYDMRRLYLGPYAGRSMELLGETAGILSNPNCQFEANFVAVRSLARFLGGQTEARERFLEALNAWLPMFQTRSGPPILQSDLELLGDLFYLPFQNGERAERFLEDFRYLRATAPDKWDQRADRFRLTAAEIKALYEKMTALNNRDLLHSLYPHLWELKETVLLLEAWVAWRQSNPESTDFASPEFRPRVFRGGLVSAFERLLPMNERGRFPL